ncbi:succinylglutamate desuccinylase/aspartoacylase family protein [Paracoccus sp. pheM1]|uniref:succinylglutamate desuccinylase/aspartoacylase domain-containing protein n=1 Tax=Paracoccus sp. pheM1 TaxID=2831675 RepID=UPI001BDB870C|nr:succinylglutamate desuccinylase/aspartoacylase family protein [Paracoccus sp. pheM1]MBT0781468.1 succinylglutamate desuccinylase/aspartoacylase family protein [Paracoccus sp. pheM1]
MNRYDTVTCELDLDAPGKASGWIDLSHSDDRHDFGVIRSPIGVIAGGEGPTALVVGGNHGDEYEGQLITRRLFEALEPQDVAGRLILVPALNMPAVMARTRVSPLDGGNMNRVFPGATGQGPTRALAGFLNRHLLPRAGLVIDLHSGGGTTNYLDAAYLTLTGDPAQDRRGAALARAFGLPWTMVVGLGSTGGDLDSAALAAGCAMISCELGGMAQVSPRSLGHGWNGILNLLAHEGIVAPEATKRLATGPACQTRFVDLGAGGRQVTAMRHALAEPLVELGDEVAEGQPVAKLYDLFDITQAPQVLTAPVAGRVLIRRRNGLVGHGDHLFVIGPEIAPEALDRRIG